MYYLLKFLVSQDHSIQIKGESWMSALTICSTDPLLFQVTAEFRFSPAMVKSLHIDNDMKVTIEFLS